MSTNQPNRAGSGMDRKIEKQSRRPLYVGGAIGGVVLLAALVFLTDRTSTSFTLDGQRIRTGEVFVGMYEDFIPLRAAVEPERTVYLDAIEGGRVERILVEDGRAAGVVLANGDELRAKAVISGCDPRRTFFGLLGEPPHSEIARCHQVRLTKEWLV